MIGPNLASGSLILVRHARPDMVDQRPGTWPLADDGTDDARRLGSSLRALVSGEAPTVVCSTEPKAIQTAEALDLGVVRPDHRLCEVDRPWYDTQGSFGAAVRHYLSGAAIAGWEPLDDAVARFVAAVADCVGPLIAVSHGTVMSAWLGRQIPHLDSVTFWNELRMPDAWLVDRATESAHRIVV
jgi:broad specificity phosphatase PhoE